MDDMNHSDERGCAIRYRGWPTNDFDPVHIMKVERGQGGVERSAPWHSVHEEQESVKFLQAPKSGHRTRWTYIAARRNLNPDRGRKHTAQVGGAPGPQFVAG